METPEHFDAIVFGAGTRGMVTAHVLNIKQAACSQRYLRALARLGDMLSEFTASQNG